MAKKIIAVVAEKGGCSKTTLAVNLACKMKHDHKKLRVAILDADSQCSAIEWLQEGKTDVDVLQLQGDLRNQVEGMDYNYIIIDTPPGTKSADITAQAILIADLTLIPVSHSSLELRALAGILEAVKKVSEADPSKKYLLVPARVIIQSTSGKEFRDTLKEYGNVSKSQLGYRVAYQDGYLYGAGVCTSDPRGEAHREISKLTEEVFQILKRSK